MSEVLVKVCGLTRVDDALACASLGADWIGLNFHPPSSRSISRELAAEIAGALDGLAEPVGLFVDRPMVEVARVASEVGLRTVQLHGDESPEDLRELQRIDPDLRVVRAFRLGDLASVDRMLAHLERSGSLGCAPFAILVDAHVPGQAGGTGRSIASDLLGHLPAHPRLILAGGLDPSNVVERVAKVRPWMVDVASGVESSPGVKDVAKVSAFVERAKRPAEAGRARLA